MMPTYNNERFISEAIQSVINQTHKRWELVIIDDGSTDKTSDISKRYALQDKRIKYHRNEKNLGIPKSRNIALKLSKGKYIGHIDSDDKLEKNALSEFNIFLNRNKVDLVYSNFYICDSKLKIIGRYDSREPTKKTFKTKPNFSHMVLYRKDEAIRLGGFNEKHDTCTDCELLLMFASKNKKIMRLDKSLYHYRKHDNNSSSIIQKKGCADCNQINDCKIPDLMRGL